MIPDGEAAPAAEKSVATDDDKKEEVRERLEQEFVETFGDDLDEDAVDWALESKLLDNNSDDTETSETDEEED